MHLEDIGQVNYVDLDRNILSASAVRHPPAIPALEDIRQRLANLRVQTHPIGKNSSRTAVRMDQPGNLIPCCEHKGNRAHAALPARQFTSYVTNHQT